MEENNASSSDSKIPTSQIPSLFSRETNQIKQSANSSKTQISGSSTTNKDAATADYNEEVKNKNGKAEAPAAADDEGGREMLKRHREEVAGRVLIPEKWGQEQLLKDWIEYATFDALFAPHRMILSARDALIADARQGRSQRLRIH